MRAYIIEWSDEDQAYIATCPSLPGCTSDGATLDEARRNIERAAKEWLDEARRLGKSPSN